MSGTLTDTASGAATRRFLAYSLAKGLCESFAVSQKVILMVMELSTLLEVRRYDKKHLKKNRVWDTFLYLTTYRDSGTFRALF